MKIRLKQFFHFKADFLGLAFLLAIGLFSSLSLLKTGYIPTHDGEYHIIRFWQFYKMLSAGSLFPRWAPDLNNGYGIPLFNYVYPLPNYLASIFHFAGFSFTDTLKMVLFSGFILSGFSFYALLRFFFKPFPSAIGSIFYLLAPYHLVDVYIRGSVGEVWALAIAPLVLLSGLARRYITFSFLIALLIFSHNILALMFIIFILVLTPFYKRKERILSTFTFYLSTLLGLGLSAIFWLPAVIEEKYVVGLKQVGFSNHFPQIWQLIFPSWGTGFSGTGGFSNQMSFQFGLSHILVIFLTIFLLRRKSGNKSLVILLLTILAVIIFLITEFSLTLWKLIPGLEYFQYPWRFLSLVIFITSFLSAWSIQIAGKRWIAVFLLCSALLFYYPYTKPVIYKERPDSYYLKNKTWSLGTDSPGNSFNTVWFKNNKEVNEKLNKTASINILSANLLPLDYTYNLTATGSTRLIINTAYFPGWNIFVNGIEKEITYKDDGLMHFNIDAGTSLVNVKFMDTKTRLLAKYISILSFILLIIITVQKIKKFL